MECVYCAIRTEYFYVVHVNFRRSVACLSPWRPKLNPSSGHVTSEVDKESRRRDFLPCQNHSIIPPHSVLSMCCCYQKHKQAKPETFHETIPFRKSGAWHRKVCTFTQPLKYQKDDRAQPEHSTGVKFLFPPHNNNNNNNNNNSTRSGIANKISCDKNITNRNR
jgi:hypothetical protein